MENDDGFDPYWLDEKDWLVTICPMPKDEDNLEELNWIGRIFGFAQLTNTRMLALVGDPVTPTYEILLSFDDQENRKIFLAFVDHDGYADSSEEGMFMVPAHEEIREARPIALVFPKHEAEFIVGV